MSAARRSQQCPRRRSGKARSKRRQPEGAWKTAARGGLLRRNGNNTTAPGEARPLRALPNRFSRSGEESCVIVLPPHFGQEEPVFENQEKPTKIRATTVMSMVRLSMVSMAAVPNEA
ncbi:MAG: hypothetical protein KKC29_02565 [Alphaproteobacteria bacterium]|jgi:hypothetical protein|nr:hypothetical protein [Alphaproteobacteria bacterium]MBU2040605.1 hypothetical protein [Alphaproteobacteria bacterium]MBU2125744.1 hypothetical protein [Alphaproteobacteria bacterium]MBU2207748.1 hypothetical protein [Alphaproteobacteria bacterium]MBU2289969.1 hypothetical protein [Alphaproteobacteria bacterium]